MSRLIFSLSQKYVSVLVRETFDLSSILYVDMGCNIGINRFVDIDLSHTRILMVLRHHKEVCLSALHHAM